MAVVVEVVEWNGTVWRRYSDSKKRNHRVYFAGYIRGEDGRLRYTSLHRAKWAHHNGPIPEGHEVHHADGNPLNNAIGNLECITIAKHRRIEGDRGSFATPKALKHLDSIRGKAAAWHSTPEGLAWHSRNGKLCAAKRPFVNLKCRHCKVAFRSKCRSTMYCGDSCREAARPLRNKTHTLRCPFCKKEYPSERRDQKYCSYSCASRARAAVRAK